MSDAGLERLMSCELIAEAHAFDTARNGVENSERSPLHGKEVVFVMTQSLRYYLDAHTRRRTRRRVATRDLLAENSRGALLSEARWS